MSNAKEEQAKIVQILEASARLMASDNPQQALDAAHEAIERINNYLIDTVRCMHCRQIVDVGTKHNPVGPRQCADRRD